VENQELFRDKRVLELGAGVGLNGLLAGHFCSSLILTDYHELILDILRQNLEYSKCPKTHVAKLEWGKETIKSVLKETGVSGIDVAIGADIIFWPASIQGLVDTLKVRTRIKHDSGAGTV
jgi:predicted nicotinamide N-methyase